VSQFTNYGENKLADFFRGQGLTLPANWFIGALSAYDEASVTEVTGIGLSRISRARSLANWAGTQGDGSTLASSGTSHTTSNNAAIGLGVATGSASIVAVGFFDAGVSGNCWMVWEFEDPLAVSSSDVVSLDVSQVKFSLGAAGGVSDYLSNKLVDLIFRAQAYAYPATLYHALYTATPSNAGGGTEVGGGVGYARAAIASSLAAWSGTQGAGTTLASSGTLGRISNNAALAHPAPSGSWGSPVAGGLLDAGTLGNLLFWHALTTPLTVSAGSPAPTFAADALGITIA
jgi:hypothetical protein